MKLSSSISYAVFCLASMAPVNSLPITNGNAAVSKRDIPGDSLKDWWPHWNGVQEGSNALINVGCSSHVGAQICADQGDWEQYTKDVIDKSIGGWVRLGFDVYQTNGGNWHRILQVIATALQEGSDQGKFIQISLRPQSGKDLGQDDLSPFESALNQLVDSYKGFKNLVIDTANEASWGGSVAGDFVTSNSELIQTLRNAGFEGFIAVEDWAWGSGLITTSDKVSLFTDGDAVQQIKDANGGNANHLIGSVHIYNGATNEKVRDEINAINSAGFIPQIGEYGNFNYAGSPNYTPDAVKYAQQYQGLVNYYNGVTLSWNDEYLNSNGEIDQNEGDSHPNKYSPDTHCYGYNSGLQGCGQSVNY